LVDLRAGIIDGRWNVDTRRWLGQRQRWCRPLPAIPWFGARKMARALFTELQEVRAQRDEARRQLETLGVLSIAQLEARRAELERQIAEQSERLAQEKSEATATSESARRLLEEARKSIVETEDLALLQEAGVYRYRHPLTDAVAYQKVLEENPNSGRGHD